jgi:hypothetical protein
MNRERILTGSNAIAALSAAGVLSTPADLYETYLTVDDVERISGLRDIKQMPFNPLRFLGSDLNFVTCDNQKILSVEFSKARHYNTYKIFVPKNFKSSISGVGEEAFAGPDFKEQTPYLLVFRQGDHTVSLTAATTSDFSHNMLSLEQLVELAKIIAQRLK